MGKTIKIYLPDENVSGIRHAEIANWSGQALECPRSQFQELREWADVRRPGVYFLFGVDDATGDDAVAIGEAALQPGCLQLTRCWHPRARHTH